MYKWLDGLKSEFSKEYVKMFLMLFYVVLLFNLADSTNHAISCTSWP